MSARGPRPQERQRAEYCDAVVRFGRDLLAKPAIDRRTLDHFRVVSSRADDLLARVEGRIVRKRRSLSPGSRQLLSILETGPGAFGPIDEERTETLHTQALAWALDTRRNDALGTAPMEALGALLLRQLDPALRDDFGLTGAVVEPELTLVESGRIDIVISTRSWLIFVEVKIDSDEGRNQLRRYRHALAREKGDRNPLLVLLTPENWARRRSRSSKRLSDEPDVLLTFADLLAGLAPVALSGVSGAHVWLRQYLHTVAVSICKLSNGGPIDTWNRATQHKAIRWVIEGGAGVGRQGR